MLNNLISIVQGYLSSSYPNSWIIILEKTKRRIFYFDIKTEISQWKQPISYKNAQKSVKNRSLSAISVIDSRHGHLILEVNRKIRYKINLEHSYLIKSGCSAVDILAMIQ